MHLKAFLLFESNSRGNVRFFASDSYLLCSSDINIGNIGLYQVHYVFSRKYYQIVLRLRILLGLTWIFTEIYKNRETSESHVCLESVN